MNQPSPLRSIKRPRSTTSTSTRTLEARILSQETLRRVDATQLPPGAGVCLGHCRTDMGPGQRAPAWADSDFDTHHPDAGATSSSSSSSEPYVEHDGPLLRKVLLIYAATLSACGWITWQWLSR